MIPLTVLPPPRKKAGYEPHMPRDRLREVTDRIMAARTLSQAVRVILYEGQSAAGSWHDYMLRLSEGLGYLLDRRATATPLAVFSKRGNSKLPFRSFSALPGHTCPGAGECLNWCYSFKAWRYANVWSRHLQNTLLLKFRKRVIAAHFKRLPRDVIVRLYVDGDFDSEETLHFWFSLLRDRPDVRAYGYSKSWDIIWDYAQGHALPSNYRLNLSSGGKAQRVSREDMLALSITRGDFLTIPTGYHGEKGFARYDDPEYHRAVRVAATGQGLAKVFSCPGKCGECAGGRHACGSELFRGITIVNGTH